MATPQSLKASKAQKTYKNSQLPAATPKGRPAPKADEAKSAKTAIVANGEVDAAIAEVNELEAKAEEEKALQAELAQEIEADVAVTSKLVKEDVSPVNTSREKLIVEYASLLKYIAQKIAARLPANIELDDLISSGVIGLMDAIEKYDSTIRESAEATGN